jgi:hypothetical protein
MKQGSTHKVQLNAVAPLTIQSVTAMTFEIFRVGSKQAIASKTIGNGIVSNNDHWLVTITADDLNVHGEVERQVKFVSEGLEYIFNLGFTEIEPSK